MDLNADTMKQQILGEEHLKLLRIGYLISAAVTAFFSLLGVAYGLLGTLIAALASSAPSRGVQQPPELVGLIFTVIGFGFTAMMLILAALKLVVAQCLKRRRGRPFCMIVAGLCCLGIPYGTLLGIFTFMVLFRPTVSRLFLATNPAVENQS